ncbi:ornithine cyclodeaminase family protein [Paenibacillus beijingensis]|uniref:Ornithine cyclodeaminase n=1 Tax=Paenibacillus beijingensis TaxID=1126833 RepID=A0A0D5NNE4_9BACL|nr:ornithine cyclodeaminase family protein [Paenibacillus beijingensis]AJY76791.1 hypothetical protein VN24_22270 [Paenibacillus beijingensis]
MAKVLVINQDLFQQLVTFEETIAIVEQAFTRFYQQRSIVFPAVRHPIEEHNGIFSIKSSYLIDDSSVGLKTGGFWKNNSKIGKTNHQSTMLLLNPETGEPVCLMDANYLTGIRTGAAGAVAAKYLARQNSRTVSLIGAGVQARTQLEGLTHLFSIEKVTVVSHTEESSRKLAEEIRQKGIAAEHSVSPRQAVEQSDIVITTTPSFSPVIKTSWLTDGTHINAIGSDTKGKREIEMDRMPDKVVCDYWEQSSSLGELQNQVTRKVLYGELGEITSGEKPGRQSASEMTLFDSTGISVQDLSVAAFAYRKAMDLKKGVYVEL